MCIAQAQTIQQCGVDGIGPTERSAILNSLPQVVPGTSSSSPWKVCLWLYHLRSSDGASQHSNINVNSILPAINAHFNGLFEFSVCGTTVIDDDRFVSMDVGTTPSSDLNDLNSYIATLNNTQASGCIRVCLSSSVCTGPTCYSGWGINGVNDAQNAGIYVAGLNAYLWSHELGHYFTLPHTFVGPATQYVNSPVIINGASFSCYQTGDGFCDTPADINCLTGTCIPLCSMDDPLGYPYSPDPTLLMSYYDVCANRFSGEQKQAMRTLYLYHPYYESIRQSVPECIYPKIGLIERECVDDPLFPNAYTFNPLPNLEVAVNSCSGAVNKTDAFGYYQIDPSGCNFGGTTLRNVVPDEDYTNPLEGVSTFDLVLIQRAMLGQITFSPYQKIAADADNSGSVTSFDIVTIRKMLLGITPSVPAGSWRYIPRLATSTPTFAVQFDDGNPFDAVFIDPFQGFTRNYKSVVGTVPNNDSWMDFAKLDKNIPNSSEIVSWSFVGVKVGDLNCSAIPGISPEDPIQKNFNTIDTASYFINANQTKTIRIKATSSEEVIAWQLGIAISSDNISVSGVHTGNATAISDTNFNNHTLIDIANDVALLNAIWYSNDTGSININEKILFEIDVVANDSTQLTDISESIFLSSKHLTTKFYNKNGVEVEDVELTLVMTGEAAQRDDVQNTPKNEFTPQNIKVYPVPFTDKLNIETNFDQTAIGRFKLMDLQGVTIVEQNIPLSKGRSHTSISGLSGYASGIYFYEVFTDNFVYRGKVIKK